MSRRVSFLCYTFLFILLLLFQTFLIYRQVAKERPKKTITSKHTCINKTLSRNMKKKVNEQCINAWGEEINGWERRKYAFVFYITNSVPEYECYLYVILHQLQVIYPRQCNIDFVILHEAGYEFKKNIHNFKNIKLIQVKNVAMNEGSKDWYYTKCYIKLEAFSLYKLYNRIIFLDVDGILMKNPYPLFQINLHPHQVGASYCNWFYPEKWLTSSIFTADLSEELYNKVKQVYTMNLRKLYPNRKTVLDMEIFNWLFEEGKKVKLYTDLINMDSHYIDKDYINRFYNSSIIPYYVHFSHIKPHLSRRISACLDETRIDAKPEFFRIHKEFWTYYYMYC